MTGEAERIFVGAQINFSIKIWEGRPKKRSSSQITPRQYGMFASFRGMFMAWCSAMECYDRDLISVLAHKFRGEYKKRSLARNLTLCHGIYLYFSSWNESLLMLGGGGGHRPLNGLSWSQACYGTFWGTQSFFGRVSLLGCTSSDLGGWPDMPHVVPSLTRYR